MKQKLYIAGKVTGLPRTEVEKNFNTLKEYFTQKGFEVISPIDLVRSPDTEWKTAMKICINQLVDCDFIYPMRNSCVSKGALLEIDIAKAFDILFLEPVDVDLSADFMLPNEGIRDEEIFKKFEKVEIKPGVGLFTSVLNQVKK